MTPPPYSLPKTFLKFANTYENLTKIYNLHHLITHLINHPWGKKKAIQCSEGSIWSRGTNRDQMVNPIGCRQAAAVSCSLCTWHTPGTHLARTGPELRAWPLTGLQL